MAVKWMEDKRFWSREDSGIIKCLVDTAKIRTLKILSEGSKNGGS